MHINLFYIIKVFNPSAQFFYVNISVYTIFYTGQFYQGSYYMYRYITSETKICALDDRN